MNRLQRILLTTSIHLANIYSVHSLIAKVVLWRLDGFYRNIVGFLISMIISWVVVNLVDFVLGKHKLSDLGYSSVRFFTATYVNVTLVFLIIFMFTLQENIGPISRTAKFLFYPFLLYAGFFFNLTCSKFAFASKDEYLKNNPQIATMTITITKIITFSIFALSFLPITVISIEYILGLFA